MVDPTRGAAEIVTGFMRSMEARNMASDKRCTVAGFNMQFPGALSFTDFAELLAWSRKRYASVRKSFDRIDVAHKDGVDVVYISGALLGSRLDDTTFRDIRYLDCFDIKDGRIVSQIGRDNRGEARLERSKIAGVPITRVGAV